MAGYPGFTPRRIAAMNAKNPPRMAADGFWARRLILMKTPLLTGPVKRGAIFLSTGCAQLRIGETVHLSEVCPDVCTGAAVHFDREISSKT
jgi:hypothetical protein